jgi:starch-binding outer membrane protein, SusD/RagB family
MRLTMPTSRALTLLGALLLVAACSDEEIPNYNNPVIPTITPSVAALQSQVTGIAAGDRENHAFQILILETMGRDAYRIDAADPRYINNPLGQFNPSAFVTNFLWNSQYRTIRSANELVASVADAGFSAAEKAGANGYAKTMKALQYMRLIEMRDTIGIPIALGQGALDPIRCKPAVLAYISTLLDDAATDLAAAGPSFLFELPGGFSSNGTFDTPATFREFNRGLKAKNEVYRGFAAYAKSGTVDVAALNAAVAATDASYADVAGNFRDGVYHVYSTASGDLLNQNFDLSVHRANPRVLSEAEAGDLRLSKVRRDPAQNLSTEGVTSDILFTIFSGPTSPIPLLINEELLLVRAEALWGLNRDAEALAIVNAIRTKSGGFAAPKVLASFPTRLDLLREILKQKRYSLLYESPSRAVDFRMFGLWSELGPERTATNLGPMVVPLPEAEVNARNNQLTCTP